MNGSLTILAPAFMSFSGAHDEGRVSPNIKETFKLFPLAAVNEKLSANSIKVYSSI